MNFNPLELMKNAKEIQAQLEKVQAELDTITATGSSGGGIVKVTMNGKFELTAVQIDPIAVDPRDVPMLQDLIVAASHDANAKIREILQAKAGPLLGGLGGAGLNIPGMGL